MSSDSSLRKRALSTIEALGRNAKKPFQPSSLRSQGSHSIANQSSTGPTETTDPSVDSIPIDVLNTSQNQTADQENTGGVRKAALSGLEAALRGLKLGSNRCPPLQSTAEGMLNCLDVIQASSDNRRECNELVSRLVIIIDDINKYLNSSPFLQTSESVASVISGLEQEVNNLCEKKQSGLSRLVGAARDLDDMMECYRRIEIHFQRLQSNAALSTWSIANEHLVNTRLEGMQPAKQARFDSAMSVSRRRECTPNTRVVVLNGLGEWRDDSESAKVYWMNGMAGTGKTTIAYSFCTELKITRQLGASFFCSQDLPDCQDATRILPTIAYQLARFSYPFRHALCQTIGDDPDIITSNVTTQFERLFVRPLLEVKTMLPALSLVVVIDALDECIDRINVQSLLAVLFRHAPSLPIKFFITCRPELGLYDRIHNLGGSVLHLHDIEQSIVQGDIETYLRAELKQASRDQVQQLVNQSGKLFIFAATVVRYVNPDDAAVDFLERLGVILGKTCNGGNKAYVPLDALYNTILASALGNRKLETVEVDAIRWVIHTVVCAREPMSLQVLAGLLDATVTKLELALKPLQSVLHFSETTKVVSTFHASFPDYMLNQGRSGEFFCDSNAHHIRLAQRCLRIMKRRLRFNICNLESSYKLDADVHDLSKRITDGIVPELMYACKYWIDHICVTTTADPDLVQMLKQFLERRFLFWLEVLNLIQHMPMGLIGVPKLRKWLQVNRLPDFVCEMAQDLHGFATTFASNPVARSTPHLYVSVLAFWDQQKPMWMHYGKLMQGLVSRGVTEKSRVLTALAVLSMKGSCGSLAISPDGSHLISTYCRSDQVAIWDIYTRQIIIGPLKAPSRVIAVAYSPDGHLFASCNVNFTIYIWDAHTGDPIGIPLQIQINRFIFTSNPWPTSLAFSHDGACIAATFNDQAIHMWNTRTGDKMPSRFSVPGDIILALAFTLDGEKIIAGSEKGLIYIWNLHSGNMAIDPIIGHTLEVITVACSTDGTRVASGAIDGAIRIWDAQTGDLGACPDYDIHTRSVMSVVFSPDGKYIASSSAERTICIWDAQTGFMHAGPMQGHTAAIHSIIYMPDGTRLISGSADETVRIWDAQSPWDVGQLSTTKHPRRNGAISAMAISPDNSHFVIGFSDNQRMRLWHTAEGCQITETLLGGDVRGVCWVTFSSDNLCVISGDEHGGVSTLDVRGEKLWEENYWADRIFCADTGIKVWVMKTGALLEVEFDPHHTLYTPWIFHRFNFPKPAAEKISEEAALQIIDRSQSSHVWSTVHSSRRCYIDDDYVLAVYESAVPLLSGSIDRQSASTVPEVAIPLRRVSEISGSKLSFPNGKFMIVTSGHHLDAIEIHDRQTGDMLAGPFKAHRSIITSVVISSDGTYAVSGDKGGRIIVWNLGLNEWVSGETINAWSVEEDGWLLGPNQERLLWVMPDLLQPWLNTRGLPIIDIKKPFGFDFEAAAIGERWRDLKWDIPNE